MMTLALGPTVWIAVGDADIADVVERISRPHDVAATTADRAVSTPRRMPAPAPLAMPLQHF